MKTLKSQPGQLTLRALTTHDQFADVVRLQQEIWGFSEAELLPRRLFIVAEKVGGQVFGAFDRSRMVAFLLALPGIRPDGQTFFHSHMLGVLTEYRDNGVGRRLKLMQRDDALSRGVGLVEWTFDPLELKNAYFNFQKLGVVVRRFVLNQYGFSTSRLHAGLPTDRCTAEWFVSSARVARTIAGDPPPPPPAEATIAVPADIDHLRATSLRKAQVIQTRVAAEFEHHLGSGLAVVGFERSERAGTYLLAKWQPELIA